MQRKSAPGPAATVTCVPLIPPVPRNGPAKTAIRRAAEGGASQDVHLAFASCDAPFSLSSLERTAKGKHEINAPLCPNKWILLFTFKKHTGETISQRVCSHMEIVHSHTMV